METSGRGPGTGWAIAAVVLGMTILWFAVWHDTGRMTEKPKQEIQRIP